MKIKNKILTLILITLLLLLTGCKKEEYKVDEIQKQSFVEDSKKGNKPKKKDNSSFNKIKNKLLSSSSTSASASTTIGSAGAIISAGVIGASIVLAPALDISIFPSENEISEDILVDYGSIDMKNYFVNIDVDDDIIIKRSLSRDGKSKIFLNCSTFVIKYGFSSVPLPA